MLNLKCPGTDREQIVDTVVPHTNRIKELADAHFDIKTAPQELRQLGGLFQRKKVETEKLHAQIEKAETQKLREELYEAMLERDKEAELAQAMLYHWMKDLVLQIKASLMSNNTKDFSYQRPAFLHNPLYSNLISKSI
jgi:hypothetical protein